MLAADSLHWVLPPYILAIPAYVLAHPLLGVAVLLVAIVVTVFFRDPERGTGEGIVSAADGRVVEAAERDGMLVVSVYMGLLDVHVNRSPLAGKVAKVAHTLGGHVPAFDKDSVRNERLTTRLDTEMGEVVVVQIAGAVARRIEPYVSVGDAVSKGQRMGMIRFGSRVDVYLPAERVECAVREGDRVMAGVSTIARVGRD